MPTPLIAQLNQNLGKTPDEIVRAINTRGWIKLTEMTEDQARALDGRAVVVGADNGGHPRPFWIVNQSMIFDRAPWFDPADRDSHFREFWFILHEEYVDGLKPDRFA